MKVKLSSSPVYDVEFSDGSVVTMRVSSRWQGLMLLEDESARCLIVTEPDGVGRMLADLFADPDGKHEATVVKGSPGFLEYSDDAGQEKS